MEIFKEYFKLSKSYQTKLNSCVSGRLTLKTVLQSAHEQLLHMPFGREIHKFLGGTQTHYQPDTHSSAHTVPQSSLHQHAQPE